MRLDGIEIQRLRGIPAGWPILKFGDKGLIVYGPNGVGKSSIIDALEKTIADRSTLFQANRAGVNWDTASEHVLGGPSAAVIHGMMSGKPVKLILGQTPPDELQPWVVAGQAASFVLRRYMLLDFINAQPRERYEQIEPFLNVKDFLRLELGLKQLCDDLENSSVSGATQINILSQRIRQVFSLPLAGAFDRPALLAILKEKLAEAGLPAQDADLAEPSKLSARLDAELGGEQTSQRLAALGASKGQLQQVTDISLLEPLYSEVFQAFDALSLALSVSAKRVPLALLEAAHEHIAANPADTCPVCEQTVDPSALLNQLERRIQEDEAVALAAKTLDNNLKALREAAQSALQAIRIFITGWGELELGELPAKYNAAVSLLEKLIKLTKQTAGEDRRAIAAALIKEEDSYSGEAARIDAAIVATGGGDRRTKIVLVKSLLTSVQNDLPKYEALVKGQKTLFKRKEVATRLHSHAVEARKEAAQSVADRVARLANDLYEEVHPGESISKSKLSVKAAASASMNLSTNFHGKETSPLAYYSESHLDTLGLCYFLAIRKLEVLASPTFKLLLLDDVLHSVDAAHRVRLARLLRAHFSDLQLVLVTHDKIFYDRLREILGGGYQYVAITDWDLTTGPKLSDPFTDLDVVTVPAARAGKSATDIAAAGGRFMEYHLKKLSEALQIAVVARFSREHDLASLWFPVAKALKKHKGFETKNPRLAADLDDNDWVRNKIAAHDNEPESPVTPQEVNKFVDKLAALYLATSCGGCGSIIKKSNADAWRCECSRLQYDN